MKLPAWLSRLFGHSMGEDRRTRSDRRSGTERRELPGEPPGALERRTGTDRRAGRDRRAGP